MELLYFFSKFFIVIIPGVISIGVYQYLTGENFTEHIKLFIGILVTTLINFMFGNSILMIINIIFSSTFTPADLSNLFTGSLPTASNASIIAATFFSIILGALLVFIKSHGILFKIANILKISPRKDNDDVWNSLFSDNEWIVFRDQKTNLAYYGRVKLYSDKGCTRELLL